jgi:hypothetical protein
MTYRRSSTVSGDTGVDRGSPEARPGMVMMWMVPSGTPSRCKNFTTRFAGFSHPGKVPVVDM